MAGGGHRPTLKLKNKSHNHGKHRSKRDLKREAHGKVNLQSLTQKNKLKEALRLEALNKRLSDRQEGWDEKRGTLSSPPRLVVIVSLEKNVKPSALLELLEESDLSSITHVSEQKITHVSAGKLKSRMCFMVPEYGDLQSVLDATRVADVVLFLLSSENGVDKFGEHCLSCVIGQGIASHMFVCQGLSDLNKKKLSDSRKMMEKHIDTRFPGEKVKSVDNWQEAQTLWRQMSSISLKEVHFRNSRPYLLSEKFEFHTQEQNQGEGSEEGLGCGILKISGYLKGQNLNVNQLIHIPGWGDFQMSQIDSSDDPYPLIIKGNKDRRGDTGKQTDQEMKDVGPRTFCIAKASNPESLQSEVIPDEMDQEQTWPTEDELGEAKERIKALKGTSDYQSSWINALENGESGSDDSDDDDDNDMTGIADQNAEGSNDGEMEEDNEPGFDTVTETDAGDDANYDEQIDMDEEKRMYEKMKEEKLHVQFPDEIDTPIDILARTRFARYRGMDSFRTSEWDPNDLLPYDYARIYRVTKHHYKRLKKISMKKIEEDDNDDSLDAEVGEFITIHVKDVPKSIMDIQKSNSVITLFGLFSNEQKMTLMSTLITRMKGFNSPVKSKESLIFQIGFRRFSANPIFSEHSFQNTKFKMERFLPSSGFIGASFYAPIMFAPAPVLVFRENVMGKYDLVAKGSLLPLDTNRIVIKRVVLSGAPFKINKRAVVVRYMFFNREDIEFYKPIELRTKYGKRGHIKQALGTHGHMKCTFSGQFKSEDTVLLNLYKRVFPKWSYNPVVSLLSPVIDDADEKDEDDNEDMVDEEEKGDAYKLFD